MILGIQDQIRYLRSMPSLERQEIEFSRWQGFCSQDENHVPIDCSNEPPAFVQEKPRRWTDEVQTHNIFSSISRMLWKWNLE